MHKGAYVRKKPTWGRVNKISSWHSSLGLKAVTAALRWRYPPGAGFFGQGPHPIFAQSHTPAHCPAWLLPLWDPAPIPKLKLGLFRLRGHLHGHPFLPRVPQGHGPA